MHKLSLLTLTSIMTTVMVLGWPEAPSPQAKVELVPGIVLNADDKAVQEILGTFRRADEAVGAGDFDGLMNLYSKMYNYHRLSRSDMRKIWKDLFTHYQEIALLHLFERVLVTHSKQGDTAEITCSGTLTGLPKGGRTPVKLDSWFREVHYLVKEGGEWRIRGNAGDFSEVPQFGTVPYFTGVAPHPLF
jgi:ketosteroid isomerase-like protein